MYWDETGEQIKQVMLPGCSDQRPLQTGVLPILTNRSCLKTDLPNISLRLNKTDDPREASLHMSWLCARRVCFTWKDVPAKSTVFLPHLHLRGCSCCYSLTSWVSLSGHKLHKDSQAAKFFFSSPEPKADVSIPLGFFITCSFYKIALASLPTLTSGEWKEKLPTCSNSSKHELSNCRWDNGDNNPISVLNSSW